MRIGYEAKRAFANTTGLGNYSRGIIKAMASIYPNNQYFIYTPKIIPGVWADQIRKFKQITIVTPKSARFSALWRSKLVVKDLRTAHIDVYHGLSHEIPIGIQKTGIKSVVTIHDLIFKRFPQYFGSISRAIYSAKINYACKNADKIIAISERTKFDLVELLNIAPNRIEVIYQDCDPTFRITQTEVKKKEVRSKYGLPENYILSIGTIEERKNLLLLIKAFKQLPPDAHLVVIGKNTPYATRVKRYIAQEGLGTRISFVSNVSFNDLPSIYQLAKVFVYPSRYEGFGIPVLEALACGVPVIAATGSCLEEAGGPDSIYVDPDNENELARKLKMILSDKELRTAMAEKGKVYAQKFETPKISAQLMVLYKNLVDHA